MGHRVAADLAAKISEFSKLWSSQVPSLAEKADGDIESGAESKCANQRRRGQQIGLASIVERKNNSWETRVQQRLAHALAVPAAIRKRAHLYFKIFFSHNVALVPRVAVAHRASRQFDFVIHEVDDGLALHKFTGPSPSPRMKKISFCQPLMGSSCWARGSEAAKMKLEGPAKNPDDRKALPQAACE